MNIAKHYIGTYVQNHQNKIKSFIIIILFTRSRRTSTTKTSIVQTDYNIGNQAELIISSLYAPQTLEQRKGKKRKLWKAPEAQHFFRRTHNPLPPEKMVFYKHFKSLSSYFRPVEALVDQFHPLCSRFSHIGWLGAKKQLTTDRTYIQFISQGRWCKLKLN